MSNKGDYGRSKPERRVVRNEKLEYAHKNNERLLDLVDSEAMDGEEEIRTARDGMSMNSILARSRP